MCQACQNEQMSEAVESDVDPLEEFVVGAKTMGFSSWEDDDKTPVNVVKTNKDDGIADSKAEEDKNENPNQLENPGDLGDAATDAHGYDVDKKITVPTKIKNLLKDEAKSAEASSEKMDYANRDAAAFYKDLAAMYTDLLNHLEGGTVYDIKQAQIMMTSLMGPMMHKIPAEVVNFIARGGQSASLKSYMTKV